MTGEEAFEAYRAFFNSYFTIFEGKHTDWLLLNEPDMTQVTPEVLNQRYYELVTIINEHFVEQTLKKGQLRDYNKMVAQLNEDAQREAHQNYLAKLKKKAEQERRLMKREGKRQARLNAKLASKKKNSKGGMDKLSGSGPGS